MTSPDGAVPSGAYVGASAAANNISTLGSANLDAAKTAATSSVMQAFGSVQLNAAALVQAGIDELLANLLRSLAKIDVLGVEPFAFLGSWADTLDAQAQQALSGVSTIASGVTGNITGASSSSNPSAVGSAVSTLNSTVQTAAQPPQITIINTSQTYTQPAGAISFDIDVFGDGGGGGRGPTTSGSGYPAGGGGVGGWQKVTLLASSLPTTFQCNVGTGGSAGTADNTAGTAGTGSSITNLAGTITYVSASGGGAGQPIPTSVSLPTSLYSGAPGTGNMTWALPNPYGGGVGGERGINSGVGNSGVSGSGGTGGAGGVSGAGAGVNGQSAASTLVPAMGGSGGGGGDGGASGNAGSGGSGGTPSGGGGGGGGFYTAGVNGNGGAGGPGRIWIKANF